LKTFTPPPPVIAAVVAEAESCLREKARGQVLVNGVRKIEEGVGPSSTGASKSEESWAGVAEAVAPRTNIGGTASRAMAHQEDLEKSNMLDDVVEISSFSRIIKLYHSKTDQEIHGIPTTREHKKKF
jgi:hypothetical protein